MAGAFRLGGWSGVAVLFSSAAALACFLLARQLQKHLTPLLAIIVLQLALAMLASALSSRPYLLAVPVLAAWTDGLLTARDRGTAPDPWLLPLMLVWSNLHGSFLFGIAMIGPFAAEAFFADRTGRWRIAGSWALFAAGAVAAALINPNGIYGLIDPVLFTMKPILARIGDWESSFFTQFGALEASLLALLALNFTRPVRLPLFRLLLLLLLVHMALAHRRHVNVFAVVAPMILAEPIAGAFAHSRIPRPAPVPWVSNLSAAAASVAAAIIAAVRLAIPNAIGEDMISPATALAHVPPGIARQHVFNADGSGGFLIWHGLHPFIDTRVELYGDVLPEYYEKIFTPDRQWLSRTLEKYNVAWTLFPPHSPVNLVLDQLPGWRRLYADNFAVIHVRKDALASTSVQKRDGRQ